MAVSWVIILGTFFGGPLQNSNNVKWPNSAMLGERKPRRLIFLNFYFKFIAILQI